MGIFTRILGRTLQQADRLPETGLASGVQEVPDSDMAAPTATLMSAEVQDNTDILRMEQDAGDRLQAQQRAERENLRIHAALACVSAKVLLTDEAHTIVYANEALMSMLRTVESDIRQHLPAFSSGNLLGRSIDMLQANPSHQRGLLDGLRSPCTTRLKLGKCEFDLSASPVFDAIGKHVGTVVEWNDRTDELEFDAIISATFAAAAQGRLDVRIEVGRQSGFMLDIVNGLNRIFATFEHVISDTSEVMGNLASGNLTRKISKPWQGSFELLKNDINSTVDKLIDVVREIRASALEVKAGAGEIASGNINLSQRTEEQAASLEETSAAMEQITTTVQHNAANAVQANTLARCAREAAENGGQVVGKAIAAMQAISDSSNRINAIIGVIDEIAFQTNLLALNAAVEAARAGDQGRGFAVVADEVRSLAGRSAKAAREIKDLIRDSGLKVQEGSALVNRSGQTLEEIVTAVKKVNDIVAEIASASDEQAIGLNEINRAIAQMDEMTQQNAALVEEAAAASASLGHQSETLALLLGFFQADEQTHMQTAPAAAPAPSKLSAPVVATVGARKVAERKIVASAPKMPGSKIPGTVPAARKGLTDKPLFPARTVQKGLQGKVASAAPIVQQGKSVSAASKGLKGKPVRSADQDDNNWAEF